MRKVCLLAVALGSCGMAGICTTAQEAAKPAPASKTPTIDQSLEMKSASNPTDFAGRAPRGLRSAIDELGRQFL